MRFIDANVFLRYLTKDDPEKASASYALLKRLEDGSEEATTSEVILAEVVYVLTRGRHGLSREDAGLRLRAIVDARGLRLPDKAVVQHALTLYLTRSLDFEDCLIIARMHSEGIEALYSYDKDFDRVPGITRMEPLIA